MNKILVTTTWSLHCLARARVATIASFLVLSSLDLRLVEKVLRSMEKLPRTDPTYQKSWSAM